MNEIAICVFVVLVVIFFILFLKKLHNTNKKKYYILIDYLIKYIKMLTYHENINYMNMLKDSSALFSHPKKEIYNLPFNYSGVFKYNHKTDFFSSDFLFTLKNSGYITDGIIFDDLTMSVSIISSASFRSENDFDCMYIDEIETINYNKSMYKIHKERDIYKIYYNNINNLENDESDIVGFFFASHIDKSIISEEEQKTLSDIISQVREII